MQPCLTQTSNFPTFSTKCRKARSLPQQTSTKIDELPPPPKWMRIPPPEKPGYGLIGPWALVGPGANTTANAKSPKPFPPFIPPLLPTSPLRSDSQNASQLLRHPIVHQEQFQPRLNPARGPSQPPIQSNKRKRQSIPNVTKNKEQERKTVKENRESIAADRQAAQTQVWTFFQAADLEELIPATPPPPSTQTRYNTRRRPSPPRAADVAGPAAESDGGYKRGAEASTTTPVKRSGCSSRSTPLRGRKFSQTRTPPSHSHPQPQPPGPGTSSSPLRKRLWTNDITRRRGPWDTSSPPPLKGRRLSRARFTRSPSSPSPRLNSSG
ncbi:uncharacterized protein PAC_17693 [Phialocephala subalpina]|uniref:Uncharacterized protein n=1 Tax=Phialocephala subalpina TaxID=576137 RepID=A0A1L7XRY1_9HELO|nr:uncharacterized protein PAC_17693 [Phialocephala subalpina]